MKRFIILVVAVAAIATTSCTSKTELAAIKEKYETVLVLNDSIDAINFRTVPGTKGDVTTITMQFTMNGETKTAVTDYYRNAFAPPVDSLEHDVQIGYFILRKSIQ